jgi:hypothetical protein
MKFIKKNGDVVEYSREIMCMNVFWKYIKPKDYYLARWKAIKVLQKEKMLAENSVSNETSYYYLNKTS